MLRLRLGPMLSGTVASSVLLGTLSACRNEEPRQAAIVDGDVSVSHVSVTPETPRWHLASEPVVRIGAVAGDAPYLFSGVVYSARLSDGRVVVVDSRSAEVRLFNPEGRFLGRQGGRGAGPGEFRHFSFVDLVPGDTLLIYDGVNRRITRIPPGGALVQSPLTIAPPATGRRGEFLGGIADGLYAVEIISTDVATAMSDTVREQVIVLAVDQTGVARDTLAHARGYLRRMTAANGGWSSLSEPFTHTTLRAARGNTVVLADDRTYRIRLLDAAGRTTAIIERTDAARVRIGDVAAEYVSAGLSAESASPRPDLPAARRRLNAALEGRHGDHLPLLSRILIDDLGCIWVADHVPWWRPGSPRTFTVFSESGALRGTMEVPSAVSIDHISHGHVTGAERDGLGVQSVVVFALDRAAANGHAPCTG